MPLRVDIRQIKAARALLRWTQADLARESCLGTATIADYERGHRETDDTQESVVRAFARFGISFSESGISHAPGMIGQRENAHGT